MLRALQAGDIETAERIRTQCRPLEDLRNQIHPVRVLHAAGLEVILDVVYNHTAESDHLGPTFCFRGLENDDYYILEPDNVHYANYSGTGNTLTGVEVETPIFC